MRKVLTYSSFVISSILVVFAFLTAKTYIQLGIAVALYPLLAFFAFKVFPLRASVHNAEPIVAVPQEPIIVKTENNGSARNDSVVVDLDRRAFLKLIGGTGLSIFLFTILGRRVENLLFNQNLNAGTGLTGGLLQDKPTLSSASVTDGYKISEIDDGIVSYYGFINNHGGWLIMKEDADTSTFRYAKGNTDFPINWNSRRDLKYDYFYNL